MSIETRRDQKQLGEDSMMKSRRTRCCKPCRLIAECDPKLATLGAGTANLTRRKKRVPGSKDWVRDSKARSIGVSRSVVRSCRGPGRQCHLVGESVRRWRPEVPRPWWCSGGDCVGGGSGIRKVDIAWGAVCWRGWINSLP